jgi:hypothetical protein
MVLTQRLKRIDAANAAYYKSRGKDFQSATQRRCCDVIAPSAYQDTKAATFIAQKPNLTVVELSYTVDGTPGAKDLYGLFTDSVARLKAVKK